MGSLTADLAAADTAPAVMPADQARLPAESSAARRPHIELEHLVTAMEAAADQHSAAVKPGLTARAFDEHSLEPGKGALGRHDSAPFGTSNTSQNSTVHRPSHSADTGQVHNDALPVPGLRGTITSSGYATLQSRAAEPQFVL